MWGTTAEANPQWWQRVSNRVWTIMRNAAVTESFLWFGINNQNNPVFSLSLPCSFLADALIYFHTAPPFLAPLQLHRHRDADLTFVLPFPIHFQQIWQQMRLHCSPHLCSANILLRKTSQYQISCAEQARGYSIYQSLLPESQHSS